MRKINNLAVAVMNFMNETNVGGLVKTANTTDLKEVIIVGRKNGIKELRQEYILKLKLLKLELLMSLLTIVEKIIII